MAQNQAKAHYIVSWGFLAIVCLYCFKKGKNVAINVSGGWIIVQAGLPYERNNIEATEVLWWWVCIDFFVFPWILCMRTCSWSPFVMRLMWLVLWSWPGFSSLFLYKRWYRCNIALQGFAVDTGVIDRRENLSLEEFRATYDGKKPVRLQQMSLSLWFFKFDIEVLNVGTFVVTIVYCYSPTLLVDSASIYM